jgi:hypothetical protein
VALLLLLAPLLQTPSQVTLTRPARVLEPEFNQVRGLRELPDGRVLISDRLDERIVVADFSTGRVTLIGRAGQGPQEYHLPSGLVPMPGDSTLFVDEGNGRLGIIGPDLKIHRSFTLRLPGIPAALLPRAVDSQGRWYAQVPRWAVMTETNPGDTVPVHRIAHSGASSQIVAWVGAAGRGPSYSSGPRIPYVPFSPSDTWVAFPDGHLLVFRAADYHADRINPDGSRSSSPAVPWTRLTVTDADRYDYTRRFLAGSGSAGRGGASGPAGGITPTPPEMLKPEAIRAVIGQSEFAATKPPFTDALPRTSPDGTVWLERSGPLGAPPSYDVFDAGGRLVRRVTLPAGRRVIGVGRSALYAVATDEDGVERVEQYERP